MGLKTIGELGKIADHITQILTKREYQLDKDAATSVFIIRDQLNLFISDYMFKDEK